MSVSHMQRYWDARAREDPLYFVDTRVGYRSGDEEAFWSGGEQALARLLAAVGVEIDPGATVVDIGCGVGRLTRALAARSARVVGIDVSPAMLERARELNADLDNVEWLRGDGRTLRPLGDASADVCVSHVVFRHLPDPALTLGYVREIGRVLRPGGTAAIEFSNDPAPHRPGRTRLRDRLGGLVGRGPRGGEDRAWLGSSLDLGELERAAGGAGLTVEQVAGAGTEFCAVRLRRSAEGTGAGAPEGDVRSYYDRYWAASRTPRYEPPPELATRLAEAAAPGARVLDVGCGAANSYAPDIARRVRSYTGVDVSEQAVEIARRAGLDAHVIRDAAELPFADASFDLVICVEVLEHLFAPHRAAAEMRRVLRPGGRLVASAPNAVYWRLRWNMVRGLWNPTGDELSVEQPWRDPHIRFFSPDTLERMLRVSGFAHVDVVAFGGCFLDHLSARPTAFGRGRLYRRAERHWPRLLGMTTVAVAER